MEKKRNNLRIAEIMQKKGLTLADLTAKIIRTDKDNNQRTITKATLCSRINGNPYSFMRSLVTDALKVMFSGNALPGSVSADGGSGGGQKPGGGSETEA